MGCIQLRVRDVKISGDFKLNFFSLLKIIQIKTSNRGNQVHNFKCDLTL